MFFDSRSSYWIRTQMLYLFNFLYYFTSFVSFVSSLFPLHGWTCEQRESLSLVEIFKYPGTFLDKSLDFSVSANASSWNAGDVFILLEDEKALVSVNCEQITNREFYILLKYEQKHVDSLLIQEVNSTCAPLAPERAVSLPSPAGWPPLWEERRGAKSLEEYLQEIICTPTCCITSPGLLIDLFI